MNDDLERAKLDEMTARIRQAEKPDGNGSQGKSDRAQASRVGFDFIGSVFGGLLIGWLLDKYFPVLAPWGLIGMLFAGFGSGVWQVWRITEGKSDAKE
jgi:F0F1-type ATP synthase assembly protein I